MATATASGSTTSSWIGEITYSVTSNSISVSNFRIHKGTGGTQSSVTKYFGYTVYIDGTAFAGPSGQSITVPAGGGWSSYYSCSATKSGLAAGTSYTVQIVTTGGVAHFQQTYTYTITTSAPTYYSHTLYYNANGGSNAPSTQSSTTTNITEYLTVTSSAPSRSGYNFVRWNTNSSGTGTNYTAGQTVGIGANSSVTLYAVWTPITYTHTLYYNANGGTGAPSTQSKTSTSSTDTITVSSTIPTKSGYTFVNWNTNTSGTGTSCVSGQSVSISANSSVTLFAVWTPTPTAHTLAYNANGGSGAPSSQTITSPLSTEYMFVSSDIPTNSGSTFKCWNTNSLGTGTNYAQGCVVPVSSNETVTLYALWAIPTNISNEIKVYSKKDGEYNTYPIFYKKDGEWIKPKSIYMKKDNIYWGTTT